MNRSIFHTKREGYAKCDLIFTQQSSTYSGPCLLCAHLSLDRGYPEGKAGVLFAAQAPALLWEEESEWVSEEERSQSKSEWLNKRLPSMRRTLRKFTAPALSPGSWWRQCPAGYRSFAPLDRRWWAGGTGRPAPAFSSVLERENHTWQGDGTQLGGRALERASLWGRLRRGLHLVVSAETSPTWSKPGEASARGWPLGISWGGRLPKRGWGLGDSRENQWAPKLPGEVGSAPLIPPQRAASPGRPMSYSLKHSNKAFWENSVHMPLNGPAVTSQLWGWLLDLCFPSGWSEGMCRGNFRGRHLTLVSHLPANLPSLLCPRCLVASVYTGLYHLRGTLLCELEPSWHPVRTDECPCPWEGRQWEGRQVSSPRQWPVEWDQPKAVWAAPSTEAKLSESIIPAVL